MFIYNIRALIKKFIFCFIFIFFPISLWGLFQRDLIIILDDGSELPQYDESEGTLFSHKTHMTALLSKMIKQKAAPILCSKSVFENFLVRFVDFKPKVLNSDENNFRLEKDCCFYNEVFSENFKKNNTSIGNGESLDEEVCSKLDRLQFSVKDCFYFSENTLSYKYLESLEFNCFIYSTSFDSSDFYIYEHLQGDLLLIIPTEDENSPSLQELGLNQDCFTRIIGFDFIEREVVDQDGVAALLCNIFAKNQPNFLWNITLFGHGMDKGESGSYFCGMSKSDFLKLLYYFKSNLNINVFYYLSCFAGGRNFDGIYSDSNEEMRLFDFPIICGCLTDSPVFQGDFYHVITKPKPYLKDFKDFKKFFNFLHSVERLNSSILKKSLSFITSNFCSNSDLHGITQTPHIRMNNSDKFEVALTTEDLLLIDDNFAIENSDDIQMSEKRAIFIATQEPIIMNLYLTAYRKSIYDTSYTETEYKCPDIVSTFPGEAIHFLSNVSIDQPLEKFLKESFFPISGFRSEKTFFIQKLKCSDRELNDISIFPQKKTISFFEEVEI